MKTVRIVSSDISPNTVKIIDDAGHEIQGVASADIKMRPSGANEITLKFAYGATFDLRGVPVLDRAQLDDFAAHYGLKLVPL